MKSIIAFLHILLVFDVVNSFQQHYQSYHSMIANSATTTQLHAIPLQKQIKPKQKKKKKTVVYKHLFRHYGDISFDSWLRCQEPKPFLLSIGYTENELDEILDKYPEILQFNVHDQLAPKLRFVIETLHGGTGQLIWKKNNDDDVKIAMKQQHLDDDEECIVVSEEDDDISKYHSMRLYESTKKAVMITDDPKLFFGCQLDRIVGPYHAYLELKNLPHDKELLDNPNLFHEFLQVCNTKSIQNFVTMCQEWSTKYRQNNQNDEYTVESVETFVQDFSPGIIPAAKGLLSPENTNNKDMIPLMLRHGANPLEYDNHGIIPLFWAAGTGNINAFQVLLESIAIEHEYGDSIYDALAMEREPKDGATALHWACCGISTEFVGEGGSFDVCRYILEHSGEDRTKVVNLKTWNSNTTPLQWASWAGSAPIVDLLVVHGAEIDHVDKHGRNALHWAAAGGHVDTVGYLMDTPKAKELINQVDDDGHTPLDYANNFGREDVTSHMEEMMDVESHSRPLETTVKTYS